MKVAEKNKEKIKKLEEKEESIVSRTLGGIIPGFGKLISSMSKSSPELQKRLEETDEEIKKRLASGWSGKPKINYSYNIRTLVLGRSGEEKSKTWEGTPKKERKMIIAQKVPKVEEKDIKINIIGKKLIIEIGKKKYRKEIALPFYAGEKKVGYKNGFLRIELKGR